MKTLGIKNVILKNLGRSVLYLFPTRDSQSMDVLQRMEKNPGVYQRTQMQKRGSRKQIVPSLAQEMIFFHP